MKKRIGEILGVVAILVCVCGCLLAGSVLTSSHHVGVLVSDPEASNIRGGCSGTDHPNCSMAFVPAPALFRNEALAATVTM